jgi:hypothetical protein
VGVARRLEAPSHSIREEQAQEQKQKSSPREHGGGQQSSLLTPKTGGKSGKKTRTKKQQGHSRVFKALGTGLPKVEYFPIEPKAAVPVQEEPPSRTEPEHHSPAEASGGGQHGYCTAATISRKAWPPARSSGGTSRDRESRKALHNSEVASSENSIAEAVEAGWEPMGSSNQSDDVDNVEESCGYDGSSLVIARQIIDKFGLRGSLHEELARLVCDGQGREGALELLFNWSHSQLADSGLLPQGTGKPTGKSE